MQKQLQTGFYCLIFVSFSRWFRISCVASAVHIFHWACYFSFVVVVGILL